MELYKAHNQWSTRPADERFWTIADALAVTTAYRTSAAEKDVPYGELRVEAVDGDLQLVGRAGIPARLTHWSFGQIAGRVGAPAGYLRELPATLAAQNINHGLKTRFGAQVGENVEKASLLFHQNGGLVLRAAVSEKYERVWNSEVFERLAELEAMGWRVPPARPSGKSPVSRPATEADILDLQGSSGISVSVGDEIAPAGVYASDHDMFCFMVNERNAIRDPKGQTLGRGFFVGNSEVGGGSLFVTRFNYAHVCGNHIVWGAQGVQEVRIRHVGSVSKRFAKLAVELREYSEASASDDEAAIARAARFEIGANKDEVLEAVFAFAAKERVELSQRIVGEAYDLAERRSDVYGSPRSVWGMVNGLTELSQRSGFADERNRIDRAAGKIMKLATF